ncbi:glutathione-independent formaldehyde dehydrogenase [Methylovirgula sp. HY1]|uniref:glutathione-independent formaldehyde dehydrogenase n=1 Tax=Methylovirgula sp. HY1 TaxID=2822761 RepID=UPI001C5AF991|nr:glutathione-independent formaldehyde dehydrogenase [Methylovirgula sp. HY1]QXX74294.1 Glutathione-independent formaldehyde dehydrogenase [Methylovirgula sp. HY1]
MKGLVYCGPRDVRIVEVQDPRIEKETDALVQITTTNICGSDLHMYEGRTSVGKGKVLGHENLGKVIAAGRAVERVKVGDWVCLPFNIGCGFCKNCERGMTQACLTANPGKAGAAYGYAEMGPYEGGQAEALRVPFADFNCLVLPTDAEEKQNDYVMLSDIWPTGWHATELAGVQAGESVVIYGAGPVGLFAAYSAIIKGARDVMVVDRHPDRLRLAEQIGAIPIDDSREDPIDAVMKLTQGEGADKGCECVGWQCHDPAGHEVPNDTMNKLVQSVRPTGRLGVVGVFVPKDPKAADPMMKDGRIAFDFGLFFDKGLRMGSGQTPVKAYNRRLCDLIAAHKAQPSFLVSHELPLSAAPDAYKHFDARESGWTKVVLRPAA